MSSEINYTPVSKAIECIQPGSRVVLGHAAAEPVTLVKELLRQKERFAADPVEVVHMVPLYAAEYAQPENQAYFLHNSLFVGAGTREAVNSGRSVFTPCFFSEVPRLFRDGILPVDVALIQVTPPDCDGNMSFGVSVDYTLQAARSARLVVAEVNPQMPRTYGSSIHVSDVDILVDADYPIVEVSPPVITDVEERIGAHVASLIPDGANLQLGIGAIPDAVLHFLHEKKDLGIHSEMFSDGVVDLFEQGVINNRFNNVNPGKLTATFLMGTKRLYDFVDNNPLVDMRPVDFTNNILVAGRVDNLMSINAALEVDLCGQVCADMIGSRQFSSVGGQVDFVRAASLSKGGKSIIAFPSTGKKGSISRIVASLKAGACVTTSRSDVHYIVTEYGIADLRGRTATERAKALIAIAHPDFRDGLTQAFEQ